MIPNSRTPKVHVEVSVTPGSRHETIVLDLWPVALGPQIRGPGRVDLRRLLPAVLGERRRASVLDLLDLLQVRVLRPL